MHDLATHTSPALSIALQHPQDECYNASAIRTCFISNPQHHGKTGPATRATASVFAFLASRSRGSLCGHRADTSVPPVCLV